MYHDPGFCAIEWNDKVAEGAESSLLFRCEAGLGVVLHLARERGEPAFHPISGVQSESALGV